MKTFNVVILAAVAMLALSPVIFYAHAYCNGPVSDSWTPRTGATITINANACPGLNPHHTVSTTRTDSQLIPQSGNYTFLDDDRTYPNTGVRVNQLFTTGLGVLPSDDKTYGPFSEPLTPNCGYSIFYLVVLDSVTGQTHTLLAEGFGQTTGICPV